MEKEPTTSSKPQQGIPEQRFLIIKITEVLPKFSHKEYWEFPIGTKDRHRDCVAHEQQKAVGCVAF